MNERFLNRRVLGWNVTSVIVFGRAKITEDCETTEDKACKLAYKYYPQKKRLKKIWHVP